MQITYNAAPAAGQPGQLANSAFANARTRAAMESILPGLVVVRAPDTVDECRLPAVNKVIITDDGGTWTAGDAYITVNGVNVAVTYDTNKATMMAAVLAAFIATQAIGATSAYDGSAHTLTLIGVNNETLTATLTLAKLADGTLITGNMTIASTVGYDTDTFEGVAQLGENIENLGLGTLIGVNDKAVVVFSTALAASDTVIVTLNGTTLATITYASSHNATMQAICSLIEIQRGVVSATYAVNVITVLNSVGESLRLSVAWSDNAGGGTVSVTLSQQTTSNVTTYLATSPVPVLVEGDIFVTVEDAVTPDSTVYVRFKTAGAYGPGSVRGSASVGYAVAWTGAKFLSNGAAGGVAILHVGV